MSETRISLLGSHVPHFVHLVSHAEYVWELLSMGSEEFIRKRPAINRAQALWQFVEGVRWAFDHYRQRGTEIEQRRQFQLFEINGQTWASASRAACYLFVDVAMRVFEMMELGHPRSDGTGGYQSWSREIDRDLWTQRAQLCDFREIELPTIDFQKLREACRQEWPLVDEAVDEADKPKRLDAQVSPSAGEANPGAAEIDRSRQQADGKPDDDGERRRSSDLLGDRTMSAGSSPSKITNRFGTPMPPCPGCGSPPAANGNLDDICPRCGAYTFNCGIVELRPLPTESKRFPAPVYQQRAAPCWRPLPRTAFLQAIDDLLTFVLARKDRPGIPRSEIDHFYALDSRVYELARALNLHGDLPARDDLDRHWHVPALPRPRPQYEGLTNLPGDWDCGLFMAYPEGRWTFLIRALRDRAAAAKASGSAAPATPDNPEVAAPPKPPRDPISEQSQQAAAGAALEKVGAAIAQALASRPPLPEPKELRLIAGGAPVNAVHVMAYLTHVCRIPPSEQARLTDRQIHALLDAGVRLAGELGVPAAPQETPADTVAPAAETEVSAMPPTLESASVVAVAKPIIAVLEGGPDEERAWVSAYTRALTAARDLMHPSDRCDDWAVLADARPEAQIAMDRLHDLLGDLHFSAAFRPARRADKLKAMISIVKDLQGADERPESPTHDYCLIPPNQARWEETTELPPQLYQLLKALLTHGTWPVPFDAVEGVVGDSGKNVSNAVSRLNLALEPTKFPWTFRTKSAHVTKD
jgi:hypothetical protein